MAKLSEFQPGTSLQCPREGIVLTAPAARTSAVVQGPVAALYVVAQLRHRRAGAARRAPRRAHSPWRSGLGDRDPHRRGALDLDALGIADRSLLHAPAFDPFKHGMKIHHRSKSANRDFRPLAL